MIAALLFVATTLPDPVLTPGATNPAVTQATIATTICVAGYTATVRSVSQATKRAVIASYRRVHQNWPPGAYEVDHRVSIEIGGSNDVRNLWPQPLLEARVKDVAENRLHRSVCSGKLTLAEAQQQILAWGQG